MDPSTFMLVVAPDGKLHLISNNKKRKVLWSYVFEAGNHDSKVYSASRDDGVCSYIDAIVEARGNINLCHYQPLSSPYIEWRSDNEMRDYVEAFFGTNVVVESQEISRDLSHMRQFFRIQKTCYRILTAKWQLRFSKYQAFHYHDSSVHPYPLHVFHTHDVRLFEELCSKLCPKELEYEAWVKKIMSDETIEVKELKKDGNVSRGLFGGLFNVAVKYYPRNHFFSQVCRDLWEINGSDHVVRIFGARAVHDGYQFCFEYCPSTLHAYLSNVSEQHRPTGLLGIFRGLFYGLRYLRDQDICFVNINPWDVLLTSQREPKISGFRHFERRTRQLEVAQLHNLGKLLIFSCSDQHDLSKEQYEQKVMTTRRMFSWAYEFKDLASRLLLDRPKIQEVSFHPCLWDGEKRILFIQDVSEYMDTTPYLDGWRKMQTIRNNLFMNGDWGSKILPNIRTEMDNRAGIAGRYDYTKPRHLVSFIRNIFYHLPEILKSPNLQKEDREFLGKHKSSVEEKFRDLFPELVISIYTLLRDEVDRNERLSLRWYYGVV